MKILKKYLVLTFALYAFVINAQDVTKEPGYVDFGDLTKFESSMGVTEVFLEEDLLSVVADLTSESDPAVTELLKGLKLVKANVYKMDGFNAELDKKITEIDKKLTSANWKRIVKSKNQKENANVYIKFGTNKKDIVGLVVMAIEEDGEAAFVNIVGRIDMKAIGRLGKNLNIPNLDKIKDEM